LHNSVFIICFAKPKLSLTRRSFMRKEVAKEEVGTCSEQIFEKEKG